MIGILQLSRNERVQKRGVRFNPLFKKEWLIVNTNAIGRSDRWAKVSEDGELMEIYGPTWNAGTESLALKFHFGIKPCKYPLYNFPSHKHCENALEVFTVDNPGTLDMDDGLSIHKIGENHYRIGVHITDTTSVAEQVFDWALTRGASVYFSNKTSQGMLSPGLAEDLLSLTEGKQRESITVWIEWKDEEIIDLSHQYITVVNIARLNYENFKQRFPDKFEIMKNITKCNSSESIIEWAMLEYNKYMGKYLTENKIGLLRTKEGDLDIAKYEKSQSNNIHVNVGCVYTHMTSPIRRFPDMYNQMCLRGISVDFTDEDLELLNSRMEELSKFQYHHTIMEISKKCMDNPMKVQIKPSGDPDYVYAFLPSRRVKIPTHESYYENGISPSGTSAVIWGIMKNGRSCLRIISETSGVTDISEELPTPPEYPELKLSKSEELMAMTEDFLGYELDTFQLDCLQDIAKGKDVLGMAPTGSGKTAVAIVAIMGAFSQDTRVIYTSPIKALSNEKYSSFYKALNGRVTLLTGDIKARCTPAGGDGGGELIIMTAEILRNKLISSQSSGEVDPDIQNVSVVIQDEVHYINDPERGPVWEETTMFLNNNIQIVSLSATLSNAESFRSWLNQRRPTVLIQRHDRHVPLQIGIIESKQFRGIYSTHDSQTMKSSSFNINTKETSFPHLVHSLVKMDKCPAIVFCMSRTKCVDAAYSITKNLMISPKPQRPRGNEMCDEVWESILKEHSQECKNYEQRWEKIWNKSLGRYRKELETIPGWEREVSLLRKGIGYHHAGMFPLHREFVELLFQNKMLKAVFATETLGVGINMPARTTVFIQLDKPTGMDTRRWLKTEEFWQMAGRAGRRGMDTQGFVVYYPMGKVVPFSIFSTMVQSRPSPTESKLKIDRMFVLRNIHRGIESVSSSLLQRDIDVQIRIMEDSLTNVPDCNEENALEIMNLEERLEQKVFKLTTKQLKHVRKSLRELKSKSGNIDLTGLKKQYTQREELKLQKQWLSDTWKHTTQQLEKDSFLKNNTLTIKGLAARQLCDGCPLARATILCDGLLDNIDFVGITTILAFFVPIGKIQNTRELTKIPNYLNNILQEVAIITGKYDFDGSDISSRLMYLWCTTKDINKLSYFVPVRELGSFIKMVLRVSSFIEEISGVLMGLEKYKVLNEILNFQEKLFYGVVTNHSLYI